MNEKQVKRLRQELRKNGIDPSARSYVPLSAFNTCLTLEIGCGRSRYHRLKDALKKGANLWN